MPLVTVFLPCYNAGRFLPEALASLEAQTFRDFEILVIDDGSTDPDTLALLDRLPPTIRVIHQPNRGLAGARNTGFREARGAWVLPLDSDDRLAPAFLEKTVAKLRETPEAAFAFAYLDLFGDKSGPLAKRYNFFEQLFLNQLPYCLLQLKQCWEQAGGYDESMRLGYEDWEYNIRLGAHGFFGVAVEEPLFHYRVSAGGMLKSISAQRHAQLWQFIQAKHPRLYTWSGLFHAWRVWRRRPSNKPLWLYFPYYLLYRMLPLSWFNGLFNRLRFLMASERSAAPPQ
ncbi:MAG: glycosyltransferase family 2 protein [Magnetococcales bacterium]|nr:glycosyltransferase family 2 protein [Magnetococcales bacterium]